MFNQFIAGIVQFFLVIAFAFYDTAAFMSLLTEGLG
jgi:hypothetical protein